MGEAVNIWAELQIGVRSKADWDEKQLEKPDKKWGMWLMIEKIAGEFALEGDVERAVSYGNGHINDTYLVTTRMGTETFSYILQRINTSIFTEPAGLMENIVGVTGHLRKKITAAEGNPERETLRVIPTRSQENFYRTTEGACYRMYAFIEDTASLEQIERPQDFYEAAEAFGNFQYLLSDYPAETLHETIPDFHNTVKRFERFLAVVEEDPVGRAGEVAAEIDFLKKRQADMGALVELLQKGEIPVRVTHNDTKLNNILLDKVTGKGICIIDLDTVMPGTSLYDFGDSIRFGASTALEDEVDLSLVSMSLELFECYVKGYIKGCRGTLTETEIAMLPMGAKIMTLECGMRFLTDYLEGDTYFKIHREKQNLDRCRTQLTLVADMEKKWEQMAQIVKNAAV